MTLVDPDIARQFDRLPPHSIDAEICVLAAMMLDKNIAQAITKLIDRDDFFQTDHQVIYDVLVQLYRKSSPVDGLLVREELARKHLLEEVGGNDYLGKIFNTLPSAAHGEYYATIVRDKAILRRMISESNDAIRAAYGPQNGHAPNEIARRFADNFALIATKGTTDTFRRLGDVVIEVVESKQKNEQRRIPTGITQLDIICGGFPLGGFTLVGGRPGSGKSLLCKQFLHNVGAFGKPIGLVSIEESAEKVAENAMSNYASVENNHIVYNRLSSGEWSDIIRVTPDLAKLNFWVNDDPTRLGEVESAVTTAAVKHGCKLVVVDYLQLIEPDESGDNENREITKISKTLKACAKRLDIALVAACQLNRGNEMGTIRKPTMKDLRGSGSLEQDGDTILLLHREDYYHYQEQGYVPTQQLEIIVAKNKGGNHGVVPAHFSGKHQRVTDWTESLSDPF